MNCKRLTICCFLVAAVLVAANAPGADTVYSRNALWNTGATDNAKGSDTEVNSGSNVWKYEVVPATTNPDNRLSGSTPFYRVAASGALTWSSGNGRWEGPVSGYPRFESDKLQSRLQSGVYGYQPRVGWKAPSAGTANFSGSFGFAASDGSARSVEWAIAKRNGSSYTLLASGTTNTVEAEPLYGIGSSTITSDGKTCYLRYPTLNGNPVTGKPFPLVVVGHGSGGNGSLSATTYQHLATRGYLVCAPSFGTSFNPAAYSQDVTDIITNLLGRSDLPVDINPDRIGYSGTSMGGIIGLAKFRTDRYDSRIKAIYTRCGATYLVGGTYDWSVATPLLMLHGDADTVVDYDEGLADYADAYAPKGFITLEGVGHDLAFSPAGTFYADVCEGFFNFFLKGKQSGLQDVQTACNGVSIADYQNQWGGVLAPGEIEVADYANLSNISLQSGEELLWSFRAYSLTTPNADVYMRDQPLKLTFTATADVTPPNNVSNVQAVPGDQQIALSWTNPTNADFTGVRIQRSTTGTPSTPTSGTNVYNGAGTSFTDTPLTNGVMYYYNLFSHDGVPNYASGIAIAATPATSGDTTVVFESQAANDGWILESSENSSVGGSVSAGGTAGWSIRIGDEGADMQYKSILSFNTSSLPDGATIVSATLKLKREEMGVTSPFSWGGTCYADIKTGYFGSGATLVASDWQAAATHNMVTSMSNPVNDGDWSTGSLGPNGRASINKLSTNGGLTQLRVYMSTGDNDNGVTDCMGFPSGEFATQSSRPVLEVVYH